MADLPDNQQPDVGDDPYLKASEFTDTCQVASRPGDVGKVPLAHGFCRQAACHDVSGLEGAEHKVRFARFLNPGITTAREGRNVICQSIHERDCLLCVSCDKSLVDGKVGQPGGPNTRKASGRHFSSRSRLRTFHVRHGGSKVDAQLKRRHYSPGIRPQIVRSQVSPSQLKGPEFLLAPYQPVHARQSVDTSRVSFWTTEGGLLELGPRRDRISRRSRGVFPRQRIAQGE